MTFYKTIVFLFLFVVSCQQYEDEFEGDCYVYLYLRSPYKAVLVDIKNELSDKCKNIEIKEALFKNSVEIKIHLNNESEASVIINCLELYLYSRELPYRSIEYRYEGTILHYSYKSYE